MRFADMLAFSKVQFSLWYTCICLFTASEYGLFLADDDPKKGVWLESGRSLEYYLLRNGVRDCVLIDICLVTTHHIFHCTYKPNILEYSE